MGDNAQGEIGNGQKLVNNAELYPTPYVLSDGVVNNSESAYPNAWDVLTPSLRTPLAVTPSMVTYYTFTPYTLTTPAQQTIHTSSTSLTATATPSLLTADGKPNYGYTIVKYHWTQLSGPSSATITTPDSLNTTVTGLTN